MLLYKFRSITGESFKYSQDIFINQRLYVPVAKELNDPNEGVAVLDVKNEYRSWANQIEERNRRNVTRICAMTKSYRSSVLWAHYADEHRGICIELESDEFDLTGGKLKPVSYSNLVPVIPHNSTSRDDSAAFLNKSEEWKYEEEWRYISDSGSAFLKISNLCIRRVLLGARFNQSDLEWVSFWLKNYDATRHVPLVQMKFASTKYELFEDSEMSGLAPRIS